MVLPLGDLQPTRITPFVTYALIAINVVMYLVQVDRGDEFTMALAATPWEITHNKDIDEPVVQPPPVVRVQDPRDPFGERIPAKIRPAVIPHAPSPIPIWLTLFTSMFLHGSPMHLIGNMLYLWIVGDNVEEVLGEVRYLIVYLACGLAGSLLQIAAAPNSVIPTLGASGAIAGIMGAYVVWFPQNQIRVLVFRFITVLPAVVVIGGWIVLQIYLGSQAFGKMGESGGVAYLAHVGGAATGILVALLFYNRAQYIKAMDAHLQGWQTSPYQGY
ncbi:MAG: rhomboid family intramembrane serine protease [Paludisphaera borealis]|uniref:rhomboid family intramembrane serine protease n=1 Tax=Paludisphaera borealis TaxID=1387353 RepID=UPI002850A409|nr:rhomboid family intramembrane serine protease [Paludisphaera borealis]MDR3621536.1 rhomboid family intramembrane serine protease [Paludisphaera borealis]